MARPTNVLASAHLWIGIAGVVAFLATGQYMDRVHDHLTGMADAQRMLYRSTHLYILYAGLMNLLLGLHQEPYRDSYSRPLQVAGSLAVLVVPVMLTLAFFIEPGLEGFSRPLTRPATYLAFGGGVLLLAAHAIGRRATD